MSAPSHEWHAEAKKLHAEGVSPADIARKLQRTRSAVYWALDLNNARARHNERVNAARKALVGIGMRDPVRRTPKRDDAPVKPVEPLVSKPTLPKISILKSDEPVAPRVLRFAPRTRDTGSAGAERIREIHRRMIRQGRISEPGLPDRLHH